jgi:aconitate hydratase
MAYKDLFNTKKTLDTAAGKVSYFDVGELEKQGLGNISKLPFSIKILLESVLRNAGTYGVSEEDVKNLAAWKPEPGEISIPLKLGRVVLQDFTGVPAVVDLAAMRSAMDRFGKDPAEINPHVRSDLIIDHSVQIDFFGTSYALAANVDKEYERNTERYTMLKWGQTSLDGFHVVPPGQGIIHQVNLEHLGRVVMSQKEDGETYAFPDSLVGTDSHTVMINGLGVLGWGVGGIEIG